MLYYNRFNPFILILLQVVPKRAALLFDQLMVALQKVVDNQGKGSVGSKTSVGSKDLIGSTGISKPPAHHFNSKIVPMVDDQTVTNSINCYSKRS